jgi:hypothetical protein
MCSTMPLAQVDAHFDAATNLVRRLVAAWSPPVLADILHRSQINEGIRHCGCAMYPWASVIMRTDTPRHK